jgi:hypothetical protein
MSTDQQRLRQLARSRAYARLAKKYPKLFDRYFDEERKVLGLPPVGVLRPGPAPREQAETNA